MQVVDTGREARFDEENPGYLASGATTFADERFSLEIVGPQPGVRASRC